MKRVMIAMAVMATLLASIVSCQVYNPADNSTLASALLTDEIVTWDAVSKEFDENLNAKDFDKMYDVLVKFPTFLKVASFEVTDPADAAKKIQVNNDKKAWSKAVTDIAKPYHDAKAAYEADKDDAAKKAAYEAAKVVVEASADIAVLYANVAGLKVLWDKDNAEIWDWNNKL